VFGFVFGFLFRSFRFRSLVYQLSFFFPPCGILVVQFSIVPHSFTFGYSKKTKLEGKEMACCAGASRGKSNVYEAR
jgi:hypothetical protein